MFSNEINIYCDESNHLENDNSNVMTLGCVYLPKSNVKEVNQRIKSIKERNDYDINYELKWTKVSKNNLQLYKDLIDYFFDHEDLNSRIILIPNKSGLKHSDFKQSHDDWYYKMYFTMLKTILNPRQNHNIYIDIKDTNMYEKGLYLKQVLANSMYDFNYNIVKKVQPIRSHEVGIMQIIDILIGAVGYLNRGLQTSEPKLELIRHIQNRSTYSLTKSTLYLERKMNLFVWDRAGDERDL